MRLIETRKGFRSARLLGGWIASAAIATVVWADAPPPEKVALTNVKIVPVVGESIEKGTILIERGKIAALGKDVEIPYDARVFDLAGKVAFPGTIDANSYRGTDSPNESRPVTPQLDTSDSIDPSQLYYEDMLRIGTTTLNIMPGDNTVIGGIGRVIRPIGLTPAEMTIAEGAFLKVCVSPKMGFDRMLQLATLRETFAELDEYLNRLAERRYDEKLKEDEKVMDVGVAEAKKRGRDLIRAEDVDDEHRNILRVRGGQVKVLGEAGPTLFKPLGAFISCGAAMDVAPAVTFAKDHGFIDRTVLVLDGDCFKAIKELKAAARPVVLTSNLVHRETDPLTGKVTQTFVPKKFADAGLLFALTPGVDASLPERMLTYQAARCVREGVARDEAIRSVTLSPAKILGVADRLGSLEVGKEAYIGIYSGDPLDFASQVEKVFVAGVLAYEREKDVRMQRLTEPPAGEKK
ncbi:MAG: amidohydrolase family protein [Planctomycetes bacterium]|nr:amidohydrolase family protein [Planctomycetota bacterium]